MTRLIQVISLALIFGMAFAWPYPVVYERRLPLAYVHASVEQGPLSIFDDMDRMMAGLHARVQHMFHWPTPSMDMYDDYDALDVGNSWMETEKDVQVLDDSTVLQQKLDSMEPVCTTVINTPPTVSPRKSRRKKLPATQTTTCVKEFIHNGQKHFYEEISITDDNGLLISQSKSQNSSPVDAALDK